MSTEAETTDTNADETSAGSDANGSTGGGRKTVAQTAALAVAASAAALAAKRLLTDEHKSESQGDRGPKTQGEDSVLSTVLVSGWRAAQDSLLPVAEDAAATAGAYLARSGPEIVRERLLPRFISGFERGRSRGAGD